ncbi:hypothetical protein BVI1335_2160006 [Burkholderia vietnamiensis]|nr:hypothetical protein BVI1335_2160006 [Burkholderia vietnamiensis]
MVAVDADHRRENGRRQHTRCSAGPDLDRFRRLRPGRDERRRQCLAQCRREYFGSRGVVADHLVQGRNRPARHRRRRQSVGTRRRRHFERHLLRRERRGRDLGRRQHRLGHRGAGVDPRASSSSGIDDPGDPGRRVRRDRPTGGRARRGARSVVCERVPSGRRFADPPDQPAVLRAVRRQPGLLADLVGERVVDDRRYPARRNRQPVDRCERRAAGQRQSDRIQRRYRRRIGRYAVSVGARTTEPDRGSVGASVQRRGVVGRQRHGAGDAIRPVGRRSVDDAVADQPAAGRRDPGADRRDARRPCAHGAARGRRDPGADLQRERQHRQRRRRHVRRRRRLLSQPPHAVDRQAVARAGRTGHREPRVLGAKPARLGRDADRCRPRHIRHADASERQRRGASPVGRRPWLVRCPGRPQHRPADEPGRALQPARQHRRNRARVHGHRRGRQREQPESAAPEREPRRAVRRGPRHRRSRFRGGLRRAGQFGRRRAERDAGVDRVHGAVRRGAARRYGAAGRPRRGAREGRPADGRRSVEAIPGVAVVCAATLRAEGAVRRARAGRGRLQRSVESVPRPVCARLSGDQHTVPRFAGLYGEQSGRRIERREPAGRDRQSRHSQHDDPDPAGRRRDDPRPRRAGARRQHDGAAADRRRHRERGRRPRHDGDPDAREGQRRHLHGPERTARAEPDLHRAGRRHDDLEFERRHQRGQGRENGGRHAGAAVRVRREPLLHRRRARAGDGRRHRDAAEHTGRAERHGESDRAARHRRCGRRRHSCGQPERCRVARRECGQHPGDGHRERHPARAGGEHRGVDRREFGRLGREPGRAGHCEEQRVGRRAASLDDQRAGRGLRRQRSGWRIEAAQAGAGRLRFVEFGFAARLRRAGGDAEDAAEQGRAGEAEPVLKRASQRDAR